MRRLSGTCILTIKAFFLMVLVGYGSPAYGQDDPPNILFVISDDQSFPHASAYGSDYIETPAFDRVADEGVLFMNAFVPSPGCSPSRASILTGRYPWQNEAAGTHASTFPEKYTVMPDLLEEAGYEVGYTGKGWGPGDWEQSGRDRNPAGPAFQDHKLDPPHKHIRDIDYAANFGAFLDQRPDNTPFYFWLGTSEPHRAYEEGIGRAAGKKPEDVEVPGYLPDTPEVRGDFLDYAVEIEWFDRHLDVAIDLKASLTESEDNMSL